MSYPARCLAAPPRRGPWDPRIVFGIGSYLDAGTQASAWARSGDKLNTIGRVSKVVAHGSAGGITSSLQGGKFAHGFASAGFSEAAGPLTQGIESQAARGVVHAMIGGTASSLSGGKFANGAVTAAMSFAFNAMAHEGGNQQQGAAESDSSVPDVRLSPEDEKLALSLADKFPRADAPTESNIRILHNGEVTPLSRDNCNAPSCAFTLSQIAETRVIIHHHNIYDRSNILGREWPSGGDALVVTRGVVNVVVTPSGAVRVVERVNGTLQVRTLRGGTQHFNNYVAATWRPGMTDSEIGQAARLYRSRRR